MAQLDKLVEAVGRINDQGIKHDARLDNHDEKFERQDEKFKGLFNEIKDLNEKILKLWITFASTAVLVGLAMLGALLALK